MTVIHAGARERLDASNRPTGCPASSAGMFVIRADGTARFDRHFHDFDEFWFVAAGRGTVSVAGVQCTVEAGDIIHTAPGVDHDITTVAEEMRVFWLSGPLPEGSAGAHLHRTPADAAKHPVPVVPSSAGS